MKKIIRYSFLSVLALLATLPGAATSSPLKTERILFLYSPQLEAYAQQVQWSFKTESKAMVKRLNKRLANQKAGYRVSVAGQFAYKLTSNNSVDPMGLTSMAAANAVAADTLVQEVIQKTQATQVIYLVGFDPKPPVIKRGITGAIGAIAVYAPFEDYLSLINGLNATTKVSSVSYTAVAVDELTASQVELVINGILETDTLAFTTLAGPELNIEWAGQYAQSVNRYTAKGVYTAPSVKQDTISEISVILNGMPIKPTILITTLAAQLPPSVEDLPLVESTAGTAILFSPLVTDDDPNNELQFAWRQTRGPFVKTTPINLNEITLLKPPQGNYAFELTVTDPDGLKATGSGSATVSSAVRAGGSLGPILLLVLLIAGYLKGHQ